MLNRAQFRRQLQLGLNTSFGLEYDRYPQQWKALFDTYTSNKAYEEDVLLTGFAAAQVKGEGVGVAYDEGREMWTARYQHETIALAFGITEEAEEDGLYGSLGSKYAKALARSMAHTKEVKAANVYNNAFSTSYNGGDGKPLLATDHPLRSGGTFSNKLATPADLAESSLEDILIQISNVVDDRGLPILIRSTDLIVPTALQFVAHRITNSQLRPGTADNDPNALREMGKIRNSKVIQLLTDTDAWFVRTDCPDGMKHFQRRALKKSMEGDFETGNMRYKATERYSLGWTDPRGCFGSEGAA
jgi:hypothetical protein